MPHTPEQKVARDLPALLDLCKAVVAALESRDWDAARIAAQSCAQLLDAVAPKD